jgi:GWxTD domain-containing protein
VNNALSRNLFSLSLLALLTAISLPSTYAQQPSKGHNDPYKKWLDEDVRWIITDQERSDFKKLWTDEQRDRFVVAFWERRNPVPDAAENTYKEEHYRRLAYANEHLAQGIPGWKTDRGRFYIMYGPPDRVVRHLGSYKSLQPGEMMSSGYNNEEWRWEHIEGLGCNVILVFEDKCGCGEYRLTVGESKLRPAEDVTPLLQLRPGCSIDKELFP